jgi:hypothetical protein
MTQPEVERAMLEPVIDAAGLVGAFTGGVWRHATRKGSVDGRVEPGILREVFNSARFRLREKSCEFYGNFKNIIRARRMSRPQRTLRFGV